MRRMAKLLVPPIALAVAVAAVVWWQLAAPPRVQVALPKRGPAVEAIYATGTVEPVRWAQIAPTETGRIIDYPAIEGAKVSEGAVLVQLDDRKARGTLDELQARIRFLEASGG